MTARAAPSAPEGFLLLDKVGEGGFGAVYRAVEIDGDLPVAIKFILRGDEVVRQRFTREGVLLARLAHPRIVAIRRLGALPGPDGLPFMVLEWIDGPTLHERLTAGSPLSGREVVTVLRHLMEGLDHAHRAGVIHRDIKPSNLMLPRSGGLKIADFGLARLCEGESGLTRLGEILGTPTYMAPEQCLALPADHRADLYASGIVLYEMLVGVPPFVSSHKSAVIEAHCTQEPPPIERWVEGVPAPLATLLARLLGKHPSERPGSAAEVLAVLDALGSETPSFRPGQRPDRTPGQASVSDLRTGSLLPGGDEGQR